MYHTQSYSRLQCPEQKHNCLVDTAIARTITSVSVACIISLVNPWWNEWEAWNRSRVSASSWVQDRSERSAMAEDTSFWPYVKRWLASVEEDETPVLHQLEDGTGYLCWHHNEGSSSSQLECWCCWRHDGGDYQIHGSFVFVPLGCPPYICPRQHIFEPRVAT